MDLHPQVPSQPHRQCFAVLVTTIVIVAPYLGSFDGGFENIEGRDARE